MTKFPIKRVYTWRPDVADHRDHAFNLTLPTLPTFVDRIGMTNPIEDQGRLGSCTGNASTSAVEIVSGEPPLSRLMAYYDGRLIEGTVRQDAGAMIRDVIKGLTTKGVCLEKTWPYDIRKFAAKPTPKAYLEAKNILSKLGTYTRLVTLNDVKTALAHGLPVIFGFSVPNYFEGPEMAAGTTILRLPTASDQMIGGHAVVFVGYDDRGTQPFLWVRNSWGSSWGIQGYFKMDQRWVDDSRKLVDDMWVVNRKV